MHGAPLACAVAGSELISGPCTAGRRSVPLSPDAAVTDHARTATEAAASSSVARKRRLKSFPSFGSLRSETPVGTPPVAPDLDRSPADLQGDISNAMLRSVRDGAAAGGRRVPLLVGPVARAHERAGEDRA